jgi:hypothetical protein
MRWPLRMPVRAHVWKLCGAPDRVTIDIDATLIASHF